MQTARQFNRWLDAVAAIFAIRRRGGARLVWAIYIVAHAVGLIVVSCSQLGDRAGERWQHIPEYSDRLSEPGRERHIGRQLLVEKFKGAPSLTEKEAEAEQILGLKPDNLLRNLKIKAQEKADWFPEGCDVAKGGITRR